MGMLATRLFCWFVGIAAVISIAAAPPTRPVEPSSMLSGEAFARARAFINRTARPLERALLAFHFEHGSRDVVIAELAKFQNGDGGFASYLESDNRWHGSSPMATMIGLRMLNQVSAPDDDVHVRAAIRYLLASFDQSKGDWQALSRGVNAAPHAPWWEFHDQTGKCEVESPVFPTAAIAGYLRVYRGLLPEGFLDRITKSSLNYLWVAPLHMQMPNIETLTELVRLLPQDQNTEAVRKLRGVLAAVVDRDPQQWSRFGVQPLSFIKTPDSPFYAGLEDEVRVNLNYVITKQEADGGWPLNWSWEKSDPIAWELAKKEWRGVVALEDLEKLEAFHRITH
jgi:hypothetical protein